MNDLLHVSRVLIAAPFIIMLISTIATAIMLVAYLDRTNR